MPVKYLAIDPGKTSGYARFDENGNDDGEGTVTDKIGVYELLELFRPEVVICEQYRLFPWKSNQQAMSLFDTVRIIGAIEYWCYSNGASLFMQEPSIKSTAYLWANRTVSKTHSKTHAADAYCHGLYWLIRRDIRKPLGKIGV